MNVNEVLSELEKLGNENTKKVLMTHGAKEPFFGVKVADLKKILKKTGKDHDLALKLFETGNSDAMYLAGLMANEKLVTKEQLENWVQKAYWYYLSEFAVAWVAAESEHGVELASKWINSESEKIASSGWSVFSFLTHLKYSKDIGEKLILSLIERVEKEIFNAPPRVKYTMNGFIIAVGVNFPELKNRALEAAAKIGVVKVDMKGTSCKVPVAKDYICKAGERPLSEKKRKSVRC